MYMVEKKRRGEECPFKCAIFLFSGMSAAVRGYMHISSEDDLIRIPTAHIWGTNDTVTPTGGKELSEVCDPSLSSVFVHDFGHEVPRGHALIEAAQMVRRAIYLAN
ncbi:hypothetical protein GGR50DRAFT_174608 [Xylaria sp. CBS 124048]|nr:hypothetical protein GGR50DRAFT_174608 [Xylaria sp. CBS 124048]